MKQLPKAGKKVPELNKEHIGELPRYSYRIIYEINSVNIPDAFSGPRSLRLDTNNEGEHEECFRPIDRGQLNGDPYYLTYFTLGGA